MPEIGVKFMKPFEIILFLLGFGSILFLSYVTTRYLAGKANKVMKGRYLNIVETISLGTDKRIHLIKAGEKHILIASTSKSIEFLTKLTIDEEVLNDSTTQSPQNVFDFKALFEKYMNLYKSKKSISYKPKASDNNMEGDTFRCNLEKLKNITKKINTQIEKDEDDITNEE